MYSNEMKGFPGNMTSFEPYLFPENSDNLKTPNKTITNLAGQPPQQQPTLLRQYWNRIHWRHKIQVALPLISALVKGLLDYSGTIRKYGIYNAGQGGLAGFTQGLGLGILADVGIEGLYQLARYGRTKNWW